MDWFTCIRSFVDVVDSKSFSKAADKRFSSSSAMSRRISWLENRIGVQLLARTTRSLKLTEEGVSFYESAKKLLLDFDQIAEFAKNKRKSLSGSISVTMPLSFSKFTTITDLVAEFLRRHHEISLQLNYSNYIQDLIADNVDIAFRSSAEDIPGYSKIKILEYQVGCYATPEYVSTHAIIKQPNDLLTHNCLVNSQAYFADWPFKSRLVRTRGNVITNSPNTLIQLALRGLGVIRASKAFIQQELEMGSLVPILESEWVKPLDVYLFYRDSVGIPYRIHAFAEFFKQQLAV